MLRRLWARICTLLGAAAAVHYTSVPIWKPWRDF